MLTELKNRGVNDARMVVCDGLTGLPDAIAATWPSAMAQTCVFHLLRNSFRSLGRSDAEQVVAAMRTRSEMVLLFDSMGGYGGWAPGDI